MRATVALLCSLGLAACGGAQHHSVELVFRAAAGSATPAALQRTAEIVRVRLGTLGLSGARVTSRGTDELVVDVPESRGLDRAVALLGTTGRLRFYDWEPNVLGADCRPRPSDANITGGASAGTPGAGTIAFAEARRRAKRCHAIALMASYDAPARPLARDAQWYVLRDRPALSGEEITHPEQGFDNGPGGTGSPIVTFDFTDAGRASFMRLTRRVVQRGQASLLPGQIPEAAFQHFAIALDDRLMSVPYVDFQQSPDGIEASNGSQIEGGFTIASAQDLASALRAGVLPLELQLVSRRKR